MYSISYIINLLFLIIMSWYLFKDSPAREYRGKKVDGYQNMHKTKIIMDWGLGQLSPKKSDKHLSQNHKQQPPQKGKSLYQKQKSYHRQQKIKAIQNTIRILTQSSDQEDKQQLIKVLKNYNKKNDKIQNRQQNIQDNSRYNKAKHISRNNRSGNILNDFQMQIVDNSKKQTNNPSRNKNYYEQNINPQQKNMDSQTGKRLRFLQNSLLPLNKQDHMTAILDFDLNKDVGSSLMDSRLSGKSHFGNKKNQSVVQLGNGFNAFVPIKEKVKDMNQKLKQMYQYDQKCKRREISQVKFG